MRKGGCAAQRRHWPWVTAAPCLRLLRRFLRPPCAPEAWINDSRSQGAQAYACMSLWVLWSWQVYKLPWFCQRFDKFFHPEKQQVQGLAVPGPAGLWELLPQGERLQPSLCVPAWLSVHE